MDLHIDINDLWDIDTQKDNNTVDRNMILDVAKEAVSTSGRIVLKRPSHCDEPDEIISVYSSVEEFERDWNKGFLSGDWGSGRYRTFIQ